MKKVALYTQDGKKSGDVNLPEDLFSLSPSDSLVHQVVTAAMANKRLGLAHSKGRAEVRGGGRKPWKQKGTGRARHGSIRSPLWVGGGVTFGPDRNKKYSHSVNKKMKAKALFTVLSDKIDSISFVENISIDKPSTKAAKSCIEKLCDFSEGGKNKCTVVFSEKDDAVKKSFANIKGVKTIEIDSFNAKEALEARKIIFINPEKTLKEFEMRSSCLKLNKEATK